MGSRAEDNYFPCSLLSTEFPTASEKVPLIAVPKYRYEVGERIKANCSFGPTRPASNITWFINNVQVRVPFLPKSKLRETLPNLILWLFSLLSLLPKYKSRECWKSYLNSSTFLSPLSFLSIFALSYPYHGREGEEACWVIWIWAQYKDKESITHYLLGEAGKGSGLWNGSTNSLYNSKEEFRE